MKMILEVYRDDTIDGWCWNLVSIGSHQTCDEIKSFGYWKDKWEALREGSAFACEHNFELCAARIGGEMTEGTAYRYFCGCTCNLPIGVGFITPKSVATEQLPKCPDCGRAIKQEEVT